MRTKESVHLTGGAVVSSTGYGDGSYPVWVRMEDTGSWGNRVAEMRILFIEDDDEL